MTERRLITSDCHVGAPLSVLDDLPESYRQYFPRVEDRADGRYYVAPIRDGDDGLEPADGVQARG